MKFQSRDQDCLCARYVVHLWCTVHSVNSEIRTASKPVPSQCIRLCSYLLGSSPVRTAKYGQPSDSSPHGAQTGPPVHITSQRCRSRVSWSPGGIRFQLLCFSSLFFFLPSPSLWLCCYFLVVVGDGDSRWLLGTPAHWCACQTARRRTTVSQPPPPLITISAYPQLQAVLGLVGGLVL